MGVASSSSPPEPVDASSPAPPPTTEPVTASPPPPATEAADPPGEDGAAAGAGADEGTAEMVVVDVAAEAGKDGDGEEEGECGFCLFMKGGGCKEEFVAWEKCVEDAEASGEKSRDPTTIRALNAGLAASPPPPRQTASHSASPPSPSPTDRLPRRVPFSPPDPFDSPPGPLPNLEAASLFFSSQIRRPLLLFSLLSADP